MRLCEINRFCFIFSSSDWARFDMSAALDALEHLCPTLDLLSPALEAIITVARRRGADSDEAVQLFTTRLAISYIVYIYMCSHK